MKISDLTSKTFLNAAGAATNSYIIINYKDANTDNTVTSKVSLDDLSKAIANNLNLIKVDDGVIKNITAASNTYSESNVGAVLFTNADREKFDAIAAGAEVNVQADWNEASSSSDAYIQNKPDLSVKADKVSSATSGHLAALDSNGNLVDSGKSTSDFGTYSKPSGGIPLTDLADNTEIVSGTTPSIVGVAGKRYICGECSTLSITAPESGCIDVLFTSGATATTLTLASAKSGVTAIKLPSWFDPTSLSANTTYEINILDGAYGVVAEWT